MSWFDPEDERIKELSRFLQNRTSSDAGKVQKILDTQNDILGDIHNLDLEKSLRAVQNLARHHVSLYVYMDPTVQVPPPTRIPNLGDPGVTTMALFLQDAEKRRVQLLDPQTLHLGSAAYTAKINHMEAQGLLNRIEASALISHYTATVTSTPLRQPLPPQPAPTQQSKGKMYAALLVLLVIAALAVKGCSSSKNKTSSNTTAVKNAPIARVITGLQTPKTPQEVISEQMEEHEHKHGALSNQNANTAGPQKQTQEESTRAYGQKQGIDGNQLDALVLYLPYTVRKYDAAMFGDSNQKANGAFEKLGLTDSKNLNPEQKRAWDAVKKCTGCYTKNHAHLTTLMKKHPDELLSAICEWKQQHPNDQTDAKAMCDKLLSSGEKKNEKRFLIENDIDAIFYDKVKQGVSYESRYIPKSRIGQDLIDTYIRTQNNLKAQSLQQGYSN